MLLFIFEAAFVDTELCLVWMRRALRSEYRASCTLTFVLGESDRRCDAEFCAASLFFITFSEEQASVCIFARDCIYLFFPIGESFGAAVESNDG